VVIRTVVVVAQSLHAVIQELAAMFRLLTLSIVVGIGTLSANAAEPDTRVDESAVRKAVEQSIPFVERQGAGWIVRKKCVSCHQIPAMVWSLNAAAKRGFDIDAKRLKQWNEWATNWQNFSASKKKEELKEEGTASSNVDTIYQLLLARDDYAADDQTQLRLAAFAKHLAKAQTADGSWTPRGQLPTQRRPARETREVTTMWSLLTLNEADIDDTEWTKKREEATTFLSTAANAKSTEWWAVKLLLDNQGSDTKTLDRTRKQLITTQHEDGGWGWLSADGSDAFGTGLAIYSLCQSGLKSDDPVIARACNFLLKSQQKNGSWKVNGTKKNAANRVVPTATYWGTCWAVIGLLETLETTADKAE
jgi:hypothetical protein